MLTNGKPGGVVVGSGGGGGVGCSAGSSGQQLKKAKKDMNLLQKISMAINHAMEAFFYRWGFMVASHPIHCILGCLCLTILCAMGMLNFTIENRPDKLWLRGDSPFAMDIEWLHENVLSPLRPSLAIVEADNVLEPEVMRTLIKIHQAVRAISVNGGKTFNDLCYKLPITKVEQQNRRRKKRRRKRRSIVETDNNTNSVSATNITNEQVNTTDKPTHHLHSYDPLFGTAFADFEDEFDMDPFFTEDENELESKLTDYDDSSDLHTFDPMLSLPEDIYCYMLENMDEACYEVNPIELWSYNSTIVENLTNSEIIYIFHNHLISPVFGRFVNYTAEFGGPDIQRNENGEIVKAQSIELKWFVKVNHTDIQAGNGVTDESTGEVADKSTMEWEAEFMRVMENMTGMMPEGVKLYYATRRSFGDICLGQIHNDGLMLAVGFGVMFLYVSLMLGKFNYVEQRPLLSVAGIFCIGFSVIIACGICSAFSLASGPVNQILPFLILGIGVDDMFVIVQCWTNLYPDYLSAKKPSKMSIAERMGSALQHAGVSITVTSLTDIAAFGVGAFTTLPGLQSFSIYAAMSVLAVFFMQSTWFVAWFAIDQKRLENRQNGMCCCIQYSSDYVPNKLSQKTYCQILFNDYFSKYLLSSWISKTGVIVTTLGLLATTLYGNSQLKQDFDPMWLLPENSHLVKYINGRQANYPGVGVQGLVVANQVNWTSSFNQLETFTRSIRESEYIHKFDSWYDDFKKYSNKNFGTNIPEKELDPKRFKKYMGKFLYSPAGSKHRAHFRFDGEFNCGEKMPPVKIVMMPFQFRFFPSTEERISAMRAIKQIVRNSNLTFNENVENPKVFAWAVEFVQWESDETMATELYGSVSLSLACVMITIFFLLADIRMCIMCGICVVFTMINVGGFMFYWGIAINIISSILIVLCIGLCVDYAAHVGLAFLITPGSSKDLRAKQALRQIGPAVLNGGFSTFLSISLMAASKSLAFISFFKIFTIVVICGLWHGLFFLPVILSILGPDPYPNVFAQKESSAAASYVISKNGGGSGGGGGGVVDEEEGIVLHKPVALVCNGLTLNCDHEDDDGEEENGECGGGSVGVGATSEINRGTVGEALMFIDDDEEDNNV